MKQTPDQKLLEAAENGSLDDVIACLGKGANANAARGDKFSALHMAVWRNAPDIVKALLNHGAKPDIADRDFNTPLHLAATCGYTGIVDILLAGKADPNMKAGPLMETPLCLAALKGHTKAIEALVNGGANINHTDEFGETPLFKATRENKPAAIALLLERGASPLMENDQHHSPLIIAILGNSRIEAARALLEHGVSPSHRSKPLHFAAMKNYRETAEVLIEFGADIHETNELGQSPLMLWPEIGNIKRRIDILKANPFADHHARMRAFAAAKPQGPRL